MAAARPIRVLANAKSLLDALAERGALTPAEISDVIRVPRPTVYRLAGGLEAIDLIVSLPDGRMDLSRRWLRLADASRAGMREWSGAGAALARLAEETGQTAFLSVPRGERAVCVDWAQGQGIDVLILRPGRALPLHAGAAGRALLAASDDETLERVLGQEPFERFTDATLTTAAELREDVARTRAWGFSVSDQDVTQGIGALGVPIEDAAGRTIGCLSIGGLAEEITKGADEHVVALRREAALLGD
ncbi:IclR family transcriptional regulator [Microbacterium halophytorum]|uniref:IclR family transcriptional regulator n=1 Tax=Microbacterium halophytorum TaxID=2067568 RepID=UPI000CFC6E7F|nr:IclR family transcriptional regulator C-terminal domain-containing protein [Microbacterium halophytorum]